MAQGKVIRGGWRWRGQDREAGEILEAPKRQIMKWAEDGYVQPMADEPPAETAEAAPAPENAAAQASKPKGGGKKKGGKKKGS